MLVYVYMHVCVVGQGMAAHRIKQGRNKMVCSRGLR